MKSQSMSVLLAAGLVIVCQMILMIVYFEVVGHPETNSSSCWNHPWQPENDDTRLFTVQELSQLSSQCVPSIVMQMLRQDRLRLKELERKEYLHQVRSYRLAGLVCNQHLDPTVPKITSLEAFKCLPGDYRRKACMGGRASFPQSCSDYRRQGQTPLSFLETYGPYNASAAVARVGPDCDAPHVNCKSSPLGMGDAGQLSNGLAETQLFHKRSDGRPLWTPQVLNYLLQMHQDGKDVSPGHYPGAQPALQRAMDYIKIQNKRILVLGSISPWVESLALHLGAAAPTRTVDYNTPVSTDLRLTVQRMDHLLQDLTSLWPILISYSSVEHDGQGRYGDPLDPDGDLAAMKEYWLKLAPGGFFLLGIPFCNNDEFHWYSQRKYGPARLPVLLQGWDYVGLATSTTLYTHHQTFELSHVKNESPVLILQKPKSVGRDELLNVNRSSGGLQCTPRGRCGLPGVEDDTTKGSK